MEKNSTIPAGPASAHRGTWLGILMVSFFILAAGCQSPPPDSKDAEDTAARLKRLETRVAALELNSDVYNERNRKFERFMEESERRHSELLVSINRLHEQPEAKMPAPADDSPASKGGAAISPAPATGKQAPAPGQARYHQVQKSDTIYSISRQYNVEPAALKKMNDLKDDVIVPGQNLRVR